MSARASSPRATPRTRSTRPHRTMRLPHSSAPMPVSVRGAHAACRRGQHSWNLTTVSWARPRRSASSSGVAVSSHGRGLDRRVSSASDAMAWSTRSRATASVRDEIDSSMALWTTVPAAVRASSRSPPRPVPPASGPRRRGSGPAGACPTHSSSTGRASASGPRAVSSWWRRWWPRSGSNRGRVWPGRQEVVEDPVLRRRRREPARRRVGQGWAVSSRRGGRGRRGRRRRRGAEDASVANRKLVNCTFT